MYGYIHGTDGSLFTHDVTDYSNTPLLEMVIIFIMKRLQSFSHFEVHGTPGGKLLGHILRQPSDIPANVALTAFCAYATSQPFRKDAPRSCLTTSLQRDVRLAPTCVVSLPDQYGSSTELIRSLPDVYLVYLRM